eukprot:2722702-Prymnesium_polylepis.1
MWRQRHRAGDARAGRRAAWRRRDVAGRICWAGPSGFYEYAQSERRRIAGGWQAGRGEAAEREISRNAAARDATAGRGGGPQAARAQS